MGKRVEAQVTSVGLQIQVDHLVTFQRFFVSKFFFTSVTLIRHLVSLVQADVISQAVGVLVRFVTKATHVGFRYIMLRLMLAKTRFVGILFRAMHTGELLLSLGLLFLIFTHYECSFVIDQSKTLL